MNKPYWLREIGVITSLAASAIAVTHEQYSLSFVCVGVYGYFCHSQGSLYVRQNLQKYVDKAVSVRVKAEVERKTL